LTDTNKLNITKTNNNHTRNYSHARKHEASDIVSWGKNMSLTWI